MVLVMSTVRVRIRINCRVMVRFNNLHMSRKSRTASYLAMRHILHDTGVVQTTAVRISISNSTLLLMFFNFYMISFTCETTTTRYFFC